MGTKFKSKNGFEIVVENSDKMVGTMDWFNSLMDKSEFVIRPTIHNRPALFLKTSGENEEYRLLCMKKYQESDEFREDEFRETEDEYIYPYSYSFGNDYRYGLFTYPLTPTAEEEVENMLQKAVEAFKEWWEYEEGIVHIYPKGYNK